MNFPRRLHHSYCEGSAYFLTWRLDGSLPVARVTDVWTCDGPKFVEFDRLLDAVPTGPRWLERPDIARIVVNALRNGDWEGRYELGAWVVMPNHVHAALRPLGHHDLASTVRVIKGGSVREANRLLNRSGRRFWGEGLLRPQNSRLGTRRTGNPVYREQSRESRAVRQRRRLAVVKRRKKRGLKPRVPAPPNLQWFQHRMSE